MKKIRMRGSFGLFIVSSSLGRVKIKSPDEAAQGFRYFNSS
jgi:hypothetical protein